MFFNVVGWCVLLINSALNVCHSLKDSNILIDENLWIQLAGFEFCTPKDIAGVHQIAVTCLVRFQNVIDIAVTNIWLFIQIHICKSGFKM